MVEQIRSSWNTLLPYIAELAQAGEEKAERLDKCDIEAVMAFQAVATK